MGNAKLTDTQITALDGHKSRDQLPVYVVANLEQRIEVTWVPKSGPRPE